MRSAQCSHKVSRVEPLEELRLEIATMDATLDRLNGPFSDLDGSNSEWLELLEAHRRLPQLVAIAQGIMRHLDQIESSSQMHRRQSHEHQRNGEALMSARARLLANHEDRLHTELTEMLTGLWSDSAEKWQSLMDIKLEIKQEKS